MLCIVVLIGLLMCYCSSCSKLFHVRPVTQGDVYRAETEEIPRIFQVGGSFLPWSFLSLVIFVFSVPDVKMSALFFSRPNPDFLKHPRFVVFSDSVCQRGRVQERGWHGDGPSGWQDQLSPTQRPRVHPHAISLPYQLWGLRQASVARLQAAAGPGVSPLPRQVPQGPLRQKGGCYCSLQR